MIVTTQRLLGDVFLRQSNLSPRTLQRVTAFLEDEVRELCLDAGCPTDSRLMSWVRIISTQTGRHPQLVHARVKMASRHGWPMPTVTDILETPQVVSDERQLARQLLQELDAGEVELLYRLSLASEPFRKDQVIAVGEILPSISRPGDKFDALVGPWIEPAGNKYFRLSSLLGRAAEDNWSAERVRAMRGEYAQAIQRAGNLTFREASEGLFQAIMAKNAGLAGPVLASLVLADVDSRKGLAQSLEWILVLGDAASIFPDNRFVTHLFGLIQFRVAVACQSITAPTFAERLFREANKSLAPEVNAYIAFGAATDIILAMRVLVAPQWLLQGWLNARKLAGEDKRLDEIARCIERDRPKTGHVFPQQSFDEILFSFVLSRRGGSGYLRQFIKAVDDLLPKQREQVVSAIKADRFRLFGFIDDVWTHELTKEKPDWDEATAALEAAQRAGERWNVPELYMIAARGIAAIQDEYLHKRDEALKTLADAAAKAGDGLMIRYQRGMVHYLNKEYANAYEAWCSTFDDWPTDNEEAALYAFYAFSNSGAAAGFLNKWEDAQRAFEWGQNLALKVQRKLDALKFGMDAAYAMWKAGLRKQALTELARDLTEMERLGQTDKSTEFHTTWKVMEHIIVWFKCDAGSPNKLEIITPRPGICSEAKTKEKHDLVKDAPRGPALLSWHCLAEAELYAGLGREAYSTIVAHTDVHDYPNLIAMFEFLRARRALADDEFENIPVFAELGALALSASDPKNLDERTILEKSIPVSTEIKSTPSVTSFVEETLLCALLAMSAKDVSWRVVLDKWRAVAARMRCPTILTTAVETIKQICSATPIEIYRQYATGSLPRFSQIVAGLQLVVHPETKPAMCYVGLCVLVTDEGFATNLMLSHEALAELARKTWLARLATPFELQTPRLTVPAIKTACESNKKGLALAATILLAAGDAVNVNKLASIQSALHKLAGD